MSGPGDRKSLLIVKACDDVCATEIDHLKNIADMFKMSHCVVELHDIEKFKVSCGGKKFDYLYLAAHADKREFGSEDGKVSIRWPEFSVALCEIDCLNPESILLLACCRGGLRQVAETLFRNCDQIDYVCGPRWTVDSHDLTTGFHVFIYNMEVRREQPSISVQRASHATGYDFFCYDRVEIEDQYIYTDETVADAGKNESDTGGIPT